MPSHQHGYSRINFGTRKCTRYKGRELLCSKSQNIRPTAYYHSKIDYKYHLTMKYLTSAIVASALLGQALAICPGFNYGVGNQQNLGGGVSRCKSRCSRLTQPRPSLLVSL